jgi:hypothetical protein
VFYPHFSHGAINTPEKTFNTTHFASSVLDVDATCKCSICSAPGSPRSHFEIARAWRAGSIEHPSS